MPNNTSYGLIEKLFCSIPPEQKLQYITYELQILKKYLKITPNNEAVKDKYLQLLCQAGELFLGNKQYEQAQKYFEDANGIVSSDHYLKFEISSKLLQITEEMILLNAA